MKYIIRVKVFDETEENVITSNVCYTFKNKAEADKYMDAVYQTYNHIFVIRTDCKNIWDELKSWYEWNFILKK